MYDKNGFYHNFFWGDVSPEFVAYRLLLREEKRNIIYREAKFGGTSEDLKKVVSTAKFFNESVVLEVKKRLKEHFLSKLMPRVTRLMNFRAIQNRKKLSKMTPEQAMKAFLEYSKECPPLYWYECLPYGISIQEAVNATKTEVLNYRIRK